MMYLQFLSKIISIILDFIFPRFCYGCGELGSYICPKCLKQLNVNFVQKCHVCGKETRVGMVHLDCSDKSFLDGLIYVTTYDGVVKKLIRDMKYHSYFAIVSDIGKIMSEYLKFYNLKSEVVITGVPMHWYRKNKRGFNQSELLGKEISKILMINYSNLLKRNKNSLAQAKLSRNQREFNLKNIFSVKVKNLPKAVLIVDDVYTTGATLNECAKVLKLEGVGKVFGFVFAKSRE